MADQPIPSSPRFDALTLDAQFRDAVAVRVKAEPARIFRALQEVTLPDMKLAHLVGELRYLPSRLAGHPPSGQRQKPFLSILTDQGTLILRDDTPREIITGSAGRLHRIVDQSPVHFANEGAFADFNVPGYEKLFMSVRVAPSGVAGEYWLILEHATRALSPDAEREFRRYWRFIKPGGAFVARQLLVAVRSRSEHEQVAQKRASSGEVSAKAEATERTGGLP